MTREHTCTPYERDDCPGCDAMKEGFDGNGMQNQWQGNLGIVGSNDWISGAQGGTATGSVTIGGGTEPLTSKDVAASFAIQTPYIARSEQGDKTVVQSKPEAIAPLQTGRRIKDDDD
jgi:hypothetical protein